MTFMAEKINQTTIFGVKYSEVAKFETAVRTYENYDVIVTHQFVDDISPWGLHEESTIGWEFIAHYINRKGQHCRGIGEKSVIE